MAKKEEQDPKVETVKAKPEPKKVLVEFCETTSFAFTRRAKGSRCIMTEPEAKKLGKAVKVIDKA